jgi:hypothetical protein
MLVGSTGALQVDSGLAMAVLLLSQLPKRLEGPKETWLKTGLRVTHTHRAAKLMPEIERQNRGLLL